MKNSDKSTRIAIVGVMLTLGAYFPAALWLQHSYVPLEEPKGAVFRLNSFLKMSKNGFGYTTIIHRLANLGDTEDQPRRSPLLLFENTKPLGPAHSPQEDIEETGLGRFSHLKQVGFLFSTSDNSDPNTNGRNYWVVLPDGVGQPPNR
jgi:hypothetical protein